MLLRRVIAHVRRQEWTAIGIDLVIVVVGVFIGIQVANWNAELADERLGRTYAARLTVDLKQDLASRQALVDYYGAVLESVEHTDGLLAHPQADPQELVVAAYRASEINYSPPAAALRADPAVQTNLRYQSSDVYSAHANIQDDVVAIERALAALNAQRLPAEAAT